MAPHAIFSTLPSPNVMLDHASGRNKHLILARVEIETPLTTAAYHENPEISKRGCGSWLEFAANNARNFCTERRT